MRNVKLILRNYIYTFFGSFVKKRPNRSFFTGIMICLAISIMVISLFTTNYMTAVEETIKIANEIGDPQYVQVSMFINCAMALLMVLLFTIMRSFYPSKSSDTNVLLAMPITKAQIIISKTLYNYIFDLFTYFSILLPAFIVYVVMLNASKMIIVRGIVLCLLLDLISNGIAIIIRSIVQFVARKSKYYNIFQSIITMIFILVYFYAYISLNSFLGKFIGTVAEVRNSILPIKYILLYILDGDMLSFILMLGISIVTFVAAVLVSVSAFGKDEKMYRNKSTELKIKENKVWVSIFKKEIKYYFSISIYVVNTIFGAVLYLGVGVVVSIIGYDRLLKYFAALPSFIIDNPIVVVLLILVTLISTVVTTGSSISLEGKNLWILKVHPFDENDIFKGKIFSNIVVCCVPIIIVAIIICFVTPLKYAWLYLTLPLVVSIFGACLGLYINLIYPKLEWESEEAVVKRSMASMLSMLLPTLFAVVPFIIYFTLSQMIKISFLQFSGFIFLYYFILILIIVKLLRSRGKKLFSRI